MRALIVIFIIHLTLNVLICLKGRDVFKPYPLMRRLWTWLFVLEFVFYGASLLFYRSMADSVAHFGWLVGSSWMLFVIYLAIMVLLYDLVYLLVNRKLHRPKFLLRQPQKVKLPLFVASLTIIVVTMGIGGYNFKHPIVSEYNISIDKKESTLDALRMVVVGDMHLGYLINKKDAARIVDLIMQQKPDVILMVGDIIDASIEPLIKESMNEELQRLRAPMGVYSCLGNHEYRNEELQKVEFLRDAGITMLRDSMVTVDNAFYVVGREDIVFEDRLALAEVIERSNINPNSLPLFVVNHTPNNMDEEVNAQADLALYGHTHNGQVFPGNVFTAMVFEMAYGYKKKKNTHLYVTSGIGLAGPQYRIGTVSEIAVMNVTFE